MYDEKAGIEPTNRTDFWLALGCGQLIKMWIPSTLGQTPRNSVAAVLVEKV